MALFEFTRSQELAWDWVVAAVEREETATAAFQSYRETGGQIRTQDWYRLWNSYQDMGATWGQVTRLSPTQTVPDNFWLQAPREFSQNYVADVHMQIRNNLTGELEKTHRYVEADYKFSLSELEDNLNPEAVGSAPDVDWSVENVIGIKFYQKGNIGT